MSLNLDKSKQEQQEQEPGTASKDFLRGLQVLAIVVSLSWPMVAKRCVDIFSIGINSFLFANIKKTFLFFIFNC